jgi:hypothetical protein
MRELAIEHSSVPLDTAWIDRLEIDLAGTEREVAAAPTWVRRSLTLDQQFLTALAATYLRAETRFRDSQLAD